LKKIFWFSKFVYRRQIIKKKSKKITQLLSAKKDVLSQVWGLGGKPKKMNKWKKVLLFLEHEVFFLTKWFF
jgi:hypothetical protein